MSTGSPLKRDHGFISIWNALTAPAPTIYEPQQQRQARLLAIFHVIIAPLTLILSSFTPLYKESGRPAILLLALILVVTYFISRTRYYQWGAGIVFSATSIHLFISAVFDTTYVGFDLLYFLVVLLILFNVFFSLRITLGFAGANIAVLLLLPYVIPERVQPENVLGQAICLVIGTSIVWLANVQRDLTEMERQQQLHLITDNVRDIVSHLDSKGIIRYMSPSIKTVLGYPAEMAIGQSFHDWLALVDPEDVSIVKQTFNEMMQAVDIRTAQYRMRHAEGHYVWLEGLSSPLVAPDGSVTGIILVTRDITVRKQAEAALRASETKFRTLSDTVDAGVIIFHRKNLAFMNPAAERLLGYSLEDLKNTGNGAFAFVHPDYHALLRERLAARASSEINVFRAEVKIQQKNGALRWLFLSSAQIEYDRAPATITTFFDITDSKEAEEQRLELALEREKVLLLQQFIGDLSHDLRNPLATIGTSLYLLNRANTSEKRQYHLDVIADQMTHLERVLADLSGITELDRAGEMFVFKPVQINQLVEDIAQEYTPTAAVKNRTFRYDLVSETAQVMGDYQQLRRALSNLVNNALSYTIENGLITCTVQSLEHEIQITVQDDGIGIRTEDLPYIFDHFYRGDKARSTDTGGAGLGLTIAQRIIVAHGGSIEVQSELGAGSTVRILLPLITLEASESNPPT
jgi:PAS domain S-box-containing protein